jgi:hypothetical protein
MRKDYNDFIGDFGEGGFGSMVQMWYLCLII